MKRRELREHIFRMLFRIEFNSEEEMKEQEEFYFEELEEATGKDQEYILAEILKIADEEKPFGVIIAGDVYDKSVPSTEAVGLFDDFLFTISKFPKGTFYGLGSNLNKLRTFSPSGGS